MALSRSDHLKLKIEELDNLKNAMRGYNGDRLAKLRKSEPEEVGEVEESVSEEVAEAEAEPGACLDCGEALEPGDPVCPSCGYEAEQEAGGESGGGATDDEESDRLSEQRIAAEESGDDRSRLADLAKAKRRG